MCARSRMVRSRVLDAGSVHLVSRVALEMTNRRRLRGREIRAAHAWRNLVLLADGGGN